MACILCVLMVKQLRPYQVECTKAFFDYFESGKTGNPLFVIPMRMGKSLQMADIMKQAHQMYPPTRFISVTTESKLLTQNEQELREYWPFLSTSFYAAKLKKRNLSGQVIFASIQSIWNKVEKIHHDVDLIFVDEAQDIGEKEDAIYRKFFVACKKRWPAVKIVGFTGTPFRADSGYLHHGKKRLFTDIAYNIPISYAIEEGYWCPPTTPETVIKINTDNVPVTATNDFHQRKLAEATDKEEITRAICADMVKHGATIHPNLSWIAYATDTDHCDHVRDELQNVHGIRCESLHSKLAPDEQDGIMQAYEADEIKCLVVSGMLTKGFNKPNLGLVALIRATQSPNYYAQTATRGCTAIYAPGHDLNTKEGRKAAIAASIKPHTLILDYGDMINRLGPIDDVIVESKPESNGEGEAPLKVCPKCYTPIMAALMTCPECDYEFPYQAKINTIASNAPILAAQRVPRWARVAHVMYRRHQKSGKKPCLSVQYICGTHHIYTWRFFEWPDEESQNWWRESANTEPPTSVDEAISRCNELKKPIAILLKKEGKYEKVQGFDYDGRASCSIKSG